MHLRLATVADVQWLINSRKQILIDEGQTVTSNINDQLQAYFEKQLTSNNYVQWLVEADEQIVATGAIQFISFPPSFANPTGVRGYICNMYTAAQYRKKGIAQQIVCKLIAEAKGRDVHHLFLIASEMGKPVYKKIGFVENESYMDYLLPKESH